MRKQKYYIALAGCLFLFGVCQSESFGQQLPVDIVHYDARIAPVIGQKSIKGEVEVQFKLRQKGVRELVLRCGAMVVDRVVSQKSSLRFEQQGDRLQIELPAGRFKGKQKVKIFYHGQPRRGVRFVPEAQQMYTVFATDQWMPCEPAPEERASFELQLTVPPGLTAVSNGKPKAQRLSKDGEILFRWRMKEDVPAYCYGFVIGSMDKFIEREYGVKFQYLSADYSEKELREIFVETPEMLRFFERKAGVRYPGQCYTQILPSGRTSQEMQHFALIRNNYGQQVLEDEADINLAAHELAHQWWGNQVTCKNWKHFWLNEGMAVFMSSAYREFRFGRKAYARDIAVYRNAYEEVVDKGLDKPLRFPNWDKPTPEDRVLVYYKGAYFLHLLREELGDRIFWKGIRRYTRKYFGKPVVSSDLQRVMEKVSRKDLSRWFEEWVY